MPVGRLIPPMPPPPAIPCPPWRCALAAVEQENKTQPRTKPLMAENEIPLRSMTQVSGQTVCRHYGNSPEWRRPETARQSGQIGDLAIDVVCRFAHALKKSHHFYSSLQIS